MKIKILVQGNDGEEAVAAGAEYTRKSEWAFRMLANGLAEPLDDEAKALAEHEQRMGQNFSAVLTEAAIDHGFKSVPSLRFVDKAVHSPKITAFVGKYPHPKPVKEDKPAG